MVKRTAGVDAAYMRTYVAPYFRTFPEGYNKFECLEVGGPESAHRLLSAQIARTQRQIPVAEWNTGISLAKTEYNVPKAAVPGFYLVFRGAFLSQFQVQTPRLRDVERFVRKIGTVDEKAPGDHKRALINGKTIQLNRSKRDNTIDLATAKDLAAALGKTVFELCRLI